MEDLLSDRVVLPHELAGLLVDRDDRRCLGRRDVDVAFVLAVRRVDEDQVAVADRRRIRHVVLHHPELVHHVVAPDDVGVGLLRGFLVLHKAVVGPVPEPVHVHRHQLPAIRHVVDDAVFDERGGADALIRPVVRAPGGELVVDGLPHELAVGFAKRHQDPLVPLDVRIARPLVIGADKHHAARDHGIAVGLRAELGDPLHVLLRLHVPACRQPLHVGHHVPIGRAPPHRPVSGLRIGPGGQGQSRDRHCRRR